jgi:hypothetical protein
MMLIGQRTSPRFDVGIALGFISPPCQLIIGRISLIRIHVYPTSDSFLLSECHYHLQHGTELLFGVQRSRFPPHLSPRPPVEEHRPPLRYRLQVRLKLPRSNLI